MDSEAYGVKLVNRDGSESGHSTSGPIHERLDAFREEFGHLWDDECLDMVREAVERIQSLESSLRNVVAGNWSITEVQELLGDI